MQEAPDEIIEGIFKLAKRLMAAIKKGVGCDFVQLSVVGEDVPHFHIHLIPRYLDDNMPKYPTKNYSEEQAQDTINKITKAKSGATAKRPTF